MYICACRQKDKNWSHTDVRGPKIARDEPTLRKPEPKHTYMKIIDSIARDARGSMNLINDIMLEITNTARDEPTLKKLEPEPTHIKLTDSIARDARDNMNIITAHTYIYIENMTNNIAKQGHKDTDRPMLQVDATQKPHKTNSIPTQFGGKGGLAKTEVPAVESNVRNGLFSLVFWQYQDHPGTSGTQTSKVERPRVTLPHTEIRGPNMDRNDSYDQNKNNSSSRIPKKPPRFLDEN